MNSNTLLPFRATVSDKLIKNGSTFFDNTNTSIMRELLQNSRRAGATKVEIWRDANSGVYLYSDNGRGCEPGELMQLGGSNWGPPVEGQETPAGVGFFSLARRNPTVSSPSHGWTMDLTEDHFCGQKDISPSPVTPDPSLGMVIKFDGKAGNAFDTGLTWPPLLRYLRGIEVQFNGDIRKTDVDFFEEFETKCYCSRRYTDASGAEVMVGFADYPVYEGTVELSEACVVFNYHGYSIHDRRKLLDTTWRDKNMKNGRCVASQLRVLVPRESMLPLELPQRNEIIDTTAYRELLRRAKFEMADLLLEGFGGEFNLSNLSWEELLKEGYAGKVLLEERYFRRQVRPENLTLDIGEFDVDLDSSALTKTQDLLTPSQAAELGSKAFRVADDDLLRILVQIPESEDALEYLPGYQLLDNLIGARSSATLPLLAARYPEFFEIADKVLQDIPIWDGVQVAGVDDGKVWAGGYEDLFSSTVASTTENLSICPTIDDEPVAQAFSVQAVWDWWSSDVSYVCGIFSQEWFDRLLAGDVDTWVVNVCNAAAHLRKLYDEDWDSDDWSSGQQEKRWREELHEALASLSGRGRELLLDRIRLQVSSLLYDMHQSLDIEKGTSYSWNVAFQIAISEQGAFTVGELKLDTGEEKETAE